MLKYTGERVIPDLMKPMNSLLLEHIARYSFVIPYIKGRVLDIACGAGYGCHMIAKTRNKSITELIGVDVDIDTINYATKRYHHPVIKYKVGDALDPNLPQQLGEFDVILSFETLEHVQDDQTFVDHLLQMLKPGGKLIISTPFGRGRGQASNQPFHIHQLTIQEFVDMFNSFNEKELFLQNGVCIELAVQRNNCFYPPRQNARYPIGIMVIQKQIL